MSPSVKALRTIGFFGRIAAAGDDWQSPLILDLLAHFVAVVSFVGGNGQWRSGSVEYVANDLAVMDLAACHREVQWATLAVDDSVDFRGAAATADADRLILLPPFAPLAAR